VKHQIYKISKNPQHKKTNPAQFLFFSSKKKKRNEDFIEGNLTQKILNPKVLNIALHPCQSDLYMLCETLYTQLLLMKVVFVCLVCFVMLRDFPNHNFHCVLGTIGKPSMSKGALK
jgi:hypothetical protein